MYRDFKELGLRFIMNDYLAGNSRMEVLVLYVIQLCFKNIIQIQPQNPIIKKLLPIKPYYNQGTVITS